MLHELATSVVTVCEQEGREWDASTTTGPSTSAPHLPSFNQVANCAVLMLLLLLLLLPRTVDCTWCCPCCRSKACH